MQVAATAAAIPMRSGSGVHNRALGLAGCGDTQEEALAVLGDAIRAWCAGLRRAGGLEEALERHGIPWSEEGTGIFVSLRLES